MCWAQKEAKMHQKVHIKPFKSIANTFAETCSYSTLLRGTLGASAYVCDTIVILVRVIESLYV